MFSLASMSATETAIVYALLAVAVILLFVIAFLGILLVKIKQPKKAHAENNIDTDEFFAEAEEDYDSQSVLSAIDDDLEQDEYSGPKRESTLPKKNMKVKLATASDRAKNRYIEIHKHMKAYNLRESLEKYKNYFYIIKAGEDGNIIRTKVFMITIKNKSIILSVNLDNDEISSQIPEINTISKERRYKAYGTHVRISTMQHVDIAKKLIDKVMQKYGIQKLTKPRNKDYGKLLDKEYSVFESRGYGHLVRKEVTLEDTAKYSDFLAKRSLVYLDKNKIMDIKGKLGIVSLSELAEKFNDSARIDLQVLKAKKIVADSIKILQIAEANYLNKRLYVTADKFSASAVKMLCLCGGQAYALSRDALILNQEGVVKRPIKSRRPFLH